MFTPEIEKFMRDKNYPAFNPKAVFFDMDGVLFDSMKFHAKAWVQALNKKNLPFTEQQAYMNEGRTGASTIDEVFMQEHGRPATEAEKQEIYKLKSSLFEAYGKTEQIPFVFHLLQKVKSQGLQIFVVTGSGQTTLIHNLDINFPGIFHKDKTITAYDVKNGKPHPEPYLKALKKSGVEPWEVVVIENAPLGVKSAHAAGLFTIGVNTGPLDPKVLTENGANLVFDDMKQLHDHWENIASN
jgi:haloacid dehalogenase superfamily, subfamily IA, variant 3 with third motif having DD or ED